MAFLSLLSLLAAYHIAATNAVQATLNWNNESSAANLAPTWAIITQNSATSWRGLAQGVIPTGDCDTGLPNAMYRIGQAA